MIRLLPLLPALGVLATLVLTPSAGAAQTASPAAAVTEDSVRRLAEAGRRADAFDVGRAAVRARPDDPAALSALIVGALAAERYDEAVEAADRIVEVDADRSAHQLLFGQAYLSHARANPSIGAIGKVKKGRAAVERAIELDPDNLDARYTLLQFLLQAPGIAGGSRDGAREQAREIERRDRARGLRARVEIAAAAGDEAELRGVFDDALPAVDAEGDSGSGLIGDLLAAAASLDDRRLREELTALIYGARPEDPVAAYHRARLWVMEGERLPEAERLLLGYLAGPERRGGVASRAGAHWRLAQLYERQDRDERAAEQYRLAGSLDPRLRPGRRIPPRLEAQI